MKLSFSPAWRVLFAPFLRPSAASVPSLPPSVSLLPPSVPFLPPSVPFLPPSVPFLPPSVPFLPPPAPSQPSQPEWLKTPTGRRIGFCQYKAAKPWASILLVHGFRQHMGWWQHVAKALQGHGVSSYCLDLPHHGHSAGSLGKPTHLQPLVEAVQHALNQVHSMQSKQRIPLVLFGHSLGAMVALHTLRQIAQQPSQQANQQPNTSTSNPFRLHGLVLSAPLLGLPVWQHWPGRSLIRLLNRLAPQWPLPLGSKPQVLTHYKPLYPAYAKDPLCYQFITPRFLTLMLEGANALHRQPTCEQLPTLLLCPQEERVVSRAKMLAWVGKLPPNTRLSMWHFAGRHELFQEENWQHTLHALVSWLKMTLLHS